MENNVVENEFDLKASHYESNRLAPWYKAHAEEIVNYCPKQIDGDVLDIGCATGYQLRLLSQMYPNARLVGLDLSSNMIRQAQTHTDKTSSQFHYINDNWENLDNESQRRLSQFNFKLIVCANTFHYFANPSQAIKLMYDRLDSDGMLLLLEREKSSSVLTLFWGFLHRYLIKDQVEFYSAGNIAGYLSQAGFNQVQIVSTIKKYLWKGKLFTSIAVIKGNKLND